MKNIRLSILTHRGGEMFSELEKCSCDREIPIGNLFICNFCVAEFQERQNWLVKNLTDKQKVSAIYQIQKGEFLIFV